MYEIYCKLRDKRGVKDADVVKETGITKSTFSDWKNGRSKPKNDKLQKIADYFEVSLQYLTTGSDKFLQRNPALAPDDEQDILKKLVETLDQLENSDNLMFDGEALDDETKELLKINIENTIRTAKVTAKKKYT